VRRVVDERKLDAIAQLPDRLIQAYNALGDVAADAECLRPALLDESIERAYAAGAPQ